MTLSISRLDRRPPTYRTDRSAVVAGVRYGLDSSGVPSMPK